MRLFRRQSAPQSASQAATLLDRYAAIYPQLGAALQRALPVGWSRSWAYAEIGDRYGLVVVYYLDAAAQIAWIEAPLTLYEHFRALHNAACLAEPSQPWTNATFAIHSGGTFTVDYSYEPIPIEDEDSRMSAWKARYLPKAT